MKEGIQIKESGTCSGVNTATTVILLELINFWHPDVPVGSAWISLSSGNLITCCSDGLSLLQQSQIPVRFPWKVDVWNALALACNGS